MESKNLQFLQKLEALPEEVSAFLYSQELEKYTSDIAKKFGLNIEVVNDFLLEFFINDFDFLKLESLIKSQISNQNFFNELYCDFLGNIILPLAPFIKVDVEKEIKNKNGDLKKYQLSIDVFNEIINDKNFENLLEVSANLDRITDIKEEERLSLYFLEKDLVEVLKSNDPLSAKRINGSIIFILSKNPELAAKFSRAFLSNQEKLTKNLLIINNKKEEPTIANWISSFIKENGSDNFSNIALAKFLTSSVNCLSLDETERKLVRKIIRLYRNLSFFPDSMSNIPMEEWEIIPVDKNAPISNDSLNRNVDSLKKNVTVSGDEKLKEEEKEVLSEENQKIKELELMLEKYPNKSLERKAIENELKKIKK
jgi:hypothetical protein